MSKTFKIENNDISDGYHTFNELYVHRNILFINLALTLGNAVLKKDHYKDWDCIYLETPYGQISYHVPNTMRMYYEGKIKEDPNYKYDGHSSTEVLVRLSSMARIQQGAGE